MSSNLPADFVERRTHPCQDIVTDWRLDSQGQYYELDLKMCQLRNVEYGFEWGKESDPLPRMASVLETPSRIVRLDLSLNELQALDHAGLIPFRNLRELNASLNRICNFIGVEVLRHLYTLNLSHNSIMKIDNLVPIASLVELNLSMNELTDISCMPSMINLQLLNISNNKLRTLDGVQSLPKLRQLHAQRNDCEDIVPLTSCFHLQVVNVADNHITTLDNTVDILAQLRRLEVVSLFVSYPEKQGNPIDRNPLYRKEILHKTNIMTLDNISVRPLPRRSEDYSVEFQKEPNYKHLQNIHSLKEAARQAFEERMRDVKVTMADQVRFLQKRIIDLQNEYQVTEQRLQNDLDSCLRYLDSLTHTEIGAMDRTVIRDSVGSPAPKPWHSHRSRLDMDHSKPDYSHVKNTNEVLKLASNELGKKTTR